MDPYTILSCALLCGAAAGYARWLAEQRSSYVPLWTWATVVGGVSLVGLFIAIRWFVLPLPALPAGLAGMDLVWWTLWWAFGQLILHFAAGGVPIIVWQIRDTVAYLRKALELALKLNSP